MHHLIDRRISVNVAGTHLELFVAGHRRRRVSENLFYFVGGERDIGAEHKRDDARRERRRHRSAFNLRVERNVCRRDSRSSVAPFATTFEIERVDTIGAENFAEFVANSRPVPGATIVGASKSLFGSASARRSSLGIPRDEKPASPPSFVPAPTLITHGAFAYGLSVSGPGPALPAANNT